MTDEGAMSGTSSALPPLPGPWHPESAGEHIVTRVPVAREGERVQTVIERLSEEHAVCRVPANPPRSPLLLAPPDPAIADGPRPTPAPTSDSAPAGSLPPTPWPDWIPSRVEGSGATLGAATAWLAGGRRGPGTSGAIRTGSVTGTEPGGAAAD